MECPAARRSKRRRLRTAMHLARPGSSRDGRLRFNFGRGDLSGSELALPFTRIGMESVGIVGGHAAVRAGRSQSLSTVLATDRQSLDEFQSAAYLGVDTSFSPGHAAILDGIIGGHIA